jgi:hypothetical protein
MPSWRYAEHVKLAVIMSAFVLLLSGCGDASTPTDPFVGTWKVPTDSSVELVVARSTNGYEVSFVMYERNVGRFHFTRRNDRLVASIDNPNENTVVRERIVLDPQAGRARWFNGSQAPFDLVRDSYSTEVPSASE